MKRTGPKIRCTERYICSILTKAGWEYIKPYRVFIRGDYGIAYTVGDDTAGVDTVTLYTDCRYIATTTEMDVRTNVLGVRHTGVPIEEILAAATGAADTLEMRMNNYETRRAIGELG